MLKKTIISLFFIPILFSCSITKHKDISYLSADSENIVAGVETPTMNIYQPKNKTEKKNPVLIFVHGGNWNSGKKETYGFFGKNFAREDVVTVIPGYTLSPNANYETMTKQIAEAITWVQENIDQYGGDVSQIYLTGHSAGGHLIALATLNPKYGIDEESIAGIILNDAAGLDMHNYLLNYPPTVENDYLATWTDNPENWKAASPIYFLTDKSPKFKIYLGSKTYKSIDVSVRKFLEELNKFQPDVKLDIINKRHIPMVLQYFWSFNNRYDEILEFMEK
ncbi:alpha/beta hydrolase [Brumimicrobium glaciale]|uniref:Alpha/beta hydrolase n=1 Tax=Brumimicrobium glaciale TaxID=200475 RepID=A0A4Q4KQL4_9FLAO|nr:alpha/beta hydrolase [Brumimicrobium glaciale]RYM35786.1 alpha/beta hydrolase [Brumimicrobium glaciale]